MKEGSDPLFSGVIAQLVERLLCTQEVWGSSPRPKAGKKSSGSAVKTAIQEEGSAFILTQVLKKNKKFEVQKIL